MSLTLERTGRGLSSAICEECSKMVGMSIICIQEVTSEQFVLIQMFYLSPASYLK